MYSITRMLKESESTFEKWISVAIAEIRLVLDQPCLVLNECHLDLVLPILSLEDPSLKLLIGRGPP